MVLFDLFEVFQYLLLRLILMSEYLSLSVSKVEKRHLRMCIRRTKIQPRVLHADIRSPAALNNYNKPSTICSHAADNKEINTCKLLHRAALNGAKTA